MKQATIIFSLLAILPVALSESKPHCSAAQTELISLCSRVGTENECVLKDGCQWCIFDIPDISKCSADTAKGGCTCEPAGPRGSCVYTKTSCVMPRSEMKLGEEVCFSIEADFGEGRCPHVDYSAAGRGGFRWGKIELVVWFVGAVVVHAMLM